MVRSTKGSKTVPPSTSSTPNNASAAQVANGSTSPDSTQSLDYLGQPPSHEPSESGVSEASLHVLGAPDLGAAKARHRKQAQPKKKKRVDRAQREIDKLQKSTNLLIPKRPFQRY